MHARYRGIVFRRVAQPYTAVATDYIVRDRLR
jgi:hypothetical protein